MGKRVALYARVSTDGQTTANQLRELEATAAARGWEIVSRFVDEGISGAKGRDKRPAFDSLHKAMLRREVDIVMAWSVDRLGRSLQHLVGFLSELQDSGVDLFLHQQGLDTSTAAGRMMFQMLGVFSEFERSMIQCRVKSGMARAREQGKRFGRPPTPPAKADAIRAALLAGGKGIQKIAREFGVGTGTVQRLKAGMDRQAADVAA